MEHATADAPTCRICLGDADEGKLFSPCRCRGTMKYVHVHCLQRWRLERETAPSYYRCDQCHYEYNLRRLEAAGCLKHKWVIEFIAVSVVLSCCALAGFTVHLVDPSYELYGCPHKVSSFMLGVTIVGIVSFLASLCFPQCNRGRPIGACGDARFCHGHMCPAMPFEVPHSTERVGS
mmetsp:Transcript_58291/g.132026  ORF Transcript_58291/g.132026 Transcript_58291/m.132026 type:complete len:177 (+) Transcript_58291:279-809(+)